MNVGKLVVRRVILAYCHVRVPQQGSHGLARGLSADSHATPVILRFFGSFGNFGTLGRLLRLIHYHTHVENMASAWDLLADGGESRKVTSVNGDGDLGVYLQPELEKLDVGASENVFVNVDEDEERITIQCGPGKSV